MSERREVQDSGIYSGEKGGYLVGSNQICYFELFLCSLGGLLLIKLYCYERFVGVHLGALVF